MKEYSVQIGGDNNLEQINLQIENEEAGASEFQESKVSSNGTANIVKFRPLPAGTIPKTLIVILKGDPAPEGAKKIWEGKMIIEGKSQDVQAYRAV